MSAAGNPPPRPGPGHERLAAFVGRWATEGEVRGDPPIPFTATDVYEWLPGGFFLVHRWDAAMPDGRNAGIEIIGYDPSGGTYPLHSYDNRGETTVLHGRVDGDRWVFEGDRLRFTGEFGEGGRVLTGVWDHRASTASPWTSLMNVRLTRAG